MNKLLLAIQILVGLVCGLPNNAVRAAAVDDLRVAQLEQEIAELQRQVQQQSRRIDTLENSLQQGRVVIVSADRPSQGTNEKAWLRNANWDKVRIGVSDTDAMQALGPPTSTRKSDKGDTQTLFYALELDGGSFLSGQVVVAAHRVIEVRRPALK